MWHETVSEMLWNEAYIFIKWNANHHDIANALLKILPYLTDNVIGIDVVKPGKYFCLLTSLKLRLIEYPNISCFTLLLFLEKYIIDLYHWSRNNLFCKMILSDVKAFSFKKNQG